MHITVCTLYLALIIKFITLLHHFLWQPSRAAFKLEVFLEDLPSRGSRYFLYEDDAASEFLVVRDKVMKVSMD